MTRQGETLRVVTEHAPGTLRVATRALGTTRWFEGEVHTIEVASLATLTVELPDADASVLLRVRLQAPDGTVWIGERRF